MPQPVQQPQFNVSEPRRTQRLEPPARDDTPDPFDHSPDPFSLESSPDIRQDQGSMQVSVEEDAVVPSISLHHPLEAEDETEESQLFPGSDLF
jgi:hypothetical protein